MTEPPLISLIASGHNGGILRTTLRLADAFHSRGFRVHVLHKNPAPPYTDDMAAAIGLVKIKTFHQFSGVFWLAHYIVRQRPSVILTGVHQHAVLALRAKSLARSACGIYAAVRNPYGVSWAMECPNKLSSRRRVLKKFYARVNGIIAISEGVANDFHRLTGIGRHRITTIHNPAFDPRIRQRMVEPVDHPWFTEKNFPVVVSVGRLERQKNILMLIESFERLRDRMPCRLVLIGDGSCRTRLEERVCNSPFRHDITFLGHLFNPFPFMRLADVFALSSSWEGFGNVLVEALATGTPVVAVDSPGGTSEVLMDGSHGRLVPQGDAGAMALAMEELIAEPPPEELVIKAAERFRPDVIAAEYLRIFGFNETTAPMAGSDIPP